MPLDTEIVEFRGVIEGVSRDGQVAVVRLDAPVGDVLYAMVTPDTLGRIDLMNGRGAFRSGDRVGGQGTVGPDAILASEVRALEIAH